MTEREVAVVFEGEYTLTLEEPYDEAVVRQALQDELGFTGLLVTGVFIADGASDL